MFHNAHEYRVMYPHDAATAIARYCAPRLDDGYEVEALRRRIALRAGHRCRSTKRRALARCAAMSNGSRRAASKAGRRTSSIRKRRCASTSIVGGRLIGQVLANRYREDLKKAGLGSGHHGFEFKPPENLFYTSGAVEVRRSLDGVALKLSIAAQQALRRLSPLARATSEEAALSPLSTTALGA